MTDVVDGTPRATDVIATRDPVDVEEFGLTFTEHFRPGMTVRVVARLAKPTTIRLLQRPDGSAVSTIPRPDKYSGYVVQSGDDGGPGTVTTVLFVRGALERGSHYTFVGRQRLFDSHLRLVSARLSAAGEGPGAGSNGDGDEVDDQEEGGDEVGEGDGQGLDGEAERTDVEGEQADAEGEQADASSTGDVRTDEDEGHGGDGDGGVDRNERSIDGSEDGGNGGFVDDVVAFFEELFGHGGGTDGETETPAASPAK